jgi:NAD(P)H-flavin reductase/ferredoxin
MTFRHGCHRRIVMKSGSWLYREARLSMTSSGRPERDVTTATINNRAIEVRRDETLLQAALRHGIEFPHSCRVGGCGTCRCRIADGEVNELTESGYLLSGEEIDDGVVLACQSVPTSDIQVEVDLTRGPGIPGVVIEQELATHDITHLTIQLEQPMAYRAGQFANLRLEDALDVVRSYSFAAPADGEGRVSFFVRRVAGGRMSPRINDEDLVGSRILVDGPMGECWLRDGEAPLVMVAGGSGLSPILAMLEDAVGHQDDRPVTLLFGAREQRDLYALDRIESIAERWRGDFRFVPVLSDAADDTSWTGARGMVTDHVATHATADSHGYLCGPPPMVDAGIAALRAQGVSPGDIHCDRFTTRADVAAEDAAADTAGLWHYLKYFGFHAVGLTATVGLFSGSVATTQFLLGIVALYVLGDWLFGDDTTTPDFRRPRLLTYQLWLALPLLCLIAFAAVWRVAPGDPLGAGELILAVTGFDALAARETIGWGGHLSALILTGLMIGLIGTVTAHELTHRTWDPRSMVVGRWLLAFSFDTNFAIEHVYGHHHYVATAHDPATAPRGRNVYHHIVASTITGNISAWSIEVDRLRKKRLPMVSWHNAVLRGQLMSLILLAIAFLMAGWIGVLFFTLCGLWGKALLEIVNYMEHYGMVRDPGVPVQPRHSWNTNRRVSSWTMFNLTRHSHHHAEGEVPYQDLRPIPEAPMMISGYLTTIIVALIPPLWHHLMTPKLLAWDRDHASASELALADAANRTSGLAALRAARYTA